eukprot:183418-Rhodomonas_salina.1
MWQCWVTDTGDVALDLLGHDLAISDHDSGHTWPWVFVGHLTLGFGHAGRRTGRSRGWRICTTRSRGS